MSTRTPSPPPPTQTGNNRLAHGPRWWLIALISTVVVVALGGLGIFAWQQLQQRCVTASDPTLSGAVTEYCPPEPYKPFTGAMMFGPDGNLWYTDSQQTKIARFTVSGGAITETGAPTAPNNVAYAGLVQGSDGNLWYIANNTLGRLRLNGQFTEFALPKAMGFVGALAAGPDGVLWVTMGKGQLLKITIPSPSDATAAPQITQVAVPANTRDPMAVAQDGSLWASTFVMSGDTAQSTHITRITSAGVVTQLPLTIPGGVTALRSGPDGAMWFISTAGQGQIGRITQAGAITSFQVSQIGEMGSPNLTIAPDGNAWFSTDDSRIGRITPAGVVTTFSLPHTGGMISNLTVGPDGGVWFIQGFSQPFQPSSRIVRLTP